MFSSFDDISGVKPYSGSITATPSKKYKISNNPKSRETSTTYFVWIIVLLLFFLIATVAISAVLWNELKTFQEEFHLSLAKGLASESLEITTISSNGVDNNEHEVETERNRYLEIQVSLEQLQNKVSELELKGQHLNLFVRICRLRKQTYFFLLMKIIYRK